MNKKFVFLLSISFCIFAQEEDKVPTFSWDMLSKESKVREICANCDSMECDFISKFLNDNQAFDRNIKKIEELVSRINLADKHPELKMLQGQLKEHIKFENDSGFTLDFRATITPLAVLSVISGKPVTKLLYDNLEKDVNDYREEFERELRYMQKIFYKDVRNIVLYQQVYAALGKEIK